MKKRKKVDALEEMEYILCLSDPSTLSDKKVLLTSVTLTSKREVTKVRENHMLEQGVLWRKYLQASHYPP